MKEKADPVLMPALAQCLGERNQMIVMHPDEVIRPQDFVQFAREMIIDTQITTQIPARELGEINSIMQDRPEHAIREAIVVFAVVLFGEIERDVGNIVVHALLRGNLGACCDLSAPAKPYAGFLLECGLDGNLKSASASLCIFFGNRDSVRDYDKLLPI